MEASARRPSTEQKLTEASPKPSQCCSADTVFRVLPLGRMGTAFVHINESGKIQCEKSSSFFICWGHHSEVPPMVRLQGQKLITIQEAGHLRSRCLGCFLPRPLSLVCRWLPSCYRLFLCGHVCVLTFCRGDVSHTCLGSPIHLELSCCCKGPFSKYSHILRN